MRASCSVARTLAPPPRAFATTRPRPQTAAFSSSAASGGIAGDKARKYFASPQEAPAPREAVPWSPAVPAGALPAYDLALDFIRSTAGQADDLAALKREHHALTASIADAQKAAAEHDAGTALLAAEEYAAMRLRAKDDTERRKFVSRKIDVMETFSAFHDPQVRWEFEQGLLDPASHVARYLGREKFELGGGLDMHADRINQMHVIPDVVPPMNGLSLDLGFRYPRAAPPPLPSPDKWGWVRKVRVKPTRDDADGGRVLCGAVLKPEETLEQPELEIRYFGEGTQLHTLIMVDPDVPDHENHTHIQKLHWLVPNIPISATTQLFPSPNPALPTSSPAHKQQHLGALPPALVPYLPPHPHKGTPAHRYTFVLIAHAEPVDVEALRERLGLGLNAEEAQAEAEVEAEEGERRPFELRRLLSETWGMHPSGETDIRGKAIPEAQDATGKVAGVTFFRAEYDEEVCGRVWKDVIGKPELKFWIPLNQKLLYWTPEGLNKADAYNRRLGLAGPSPERLARFSQWGRGAEAARMTEDELEGLLDRLSDKQAQRQGQGEGDSLMGAGFGSGPVPGAEGSKQGHMPWFGEDAGEVGEAKAKAGGVRGLEEMVADEVREVEEMIAHTEEEAEEEHAREGKP